MHATISAPRFHVTADTLGAPRVHVAPPIARRPPLIVRVPPVSIPVYKTTWHDKKRRRTYTAWTIVYRDASGEHREKRADKARAITRATEIANSIANGQIAMAAFTPEDKARYHLMLKTLAPAGQPPELAVAAYSQAIEQLAAAHFPPGNLLDAVRFYLAHHAAAVTAKTCPEILSEMLKLRQQDGAARNTLDDYRSRLGRFVRDFTCPLTSISGKAIDDWLSKLNVTRRTRNNYRGNLVDFYQFAKRRGYLPKTWTPLDAVPKLKNEPVVVQVFTPDEIVKLISHRQAMEAAFNRRHPGRPIKSLIPYLTIAVFAGCRHEELCAPGLPTLDWRQVDLEKAEIHVLQEVARKIGHDRLVPMQPNLVEFLQPYAKANGPICELANVTNALLRTAAAAGVKWKDNGLRKTFISSRLALTENIGTVATEAGTSPDRIRHNYKKTLPKREARRLFEIYPNTGSILQLNFAGL